MKATDATSKVNAIQITKLEIGFKPINTKPEILNLECVLLTKKASYGLPLGISRHQTSWSKRTKEALVELVNSVEQDLLPTYFNLSKEDQDVESRIGSAEIKEDDQI